MFFSTKTIIVEFGCSKADRPKMSTDSSASILFAYTYMTNMVYHLVFVISELNAYSDRKLVTNTTLRRYNISYIRRPMVSFVGFTTNLLRNGTCTREIFVYLNLIFNFEFHQNLICQGKAISNEMCMDFQLLAEPSDLSFLETNIVINFYIVIL